MTFPISVEFNKSLRTTVTSDNKQVILEYIEQTILKNKADKVTVNEMGIAYKGSTAGRTSLFSGVDNGIFHLIHKNSVWNLTYQINMSSLFIIAVIFSTFVGGLAQATDGHWWVGLIAFSWLCGMNWLISVIRHGSLNTEIAAGIDELICGKQAIVENEVKDESLKSWF